MWRDYLKRNRLRILMYHAIDSNQGDRLTVTPEKFAAQMAYLSTNGFSVVSLERALLDLKSGTNRDRSVVLTFDDGYRDFLTNALPVLESYKFPATMFVVTRADEAHWQRNGDKKPLLSKDDLKQIKDRGVSLGSHTATHCDLTSLTDDALTSELIESRDALADLGETFIPFAYPGGTFTQRERDAVERAGYDCGVIVGGRWGNGPETDRFLLKREPMLASDSLDWFRKRVNGFYEAHYLMARARGIATR
jgi:peptidoglycan/xylan/chitin deacetylase (PgdA/CDA1 family)